MRSLSFALLMGFLLMPASLASADTWLQTDWSGGSGQQNWADTSMYFQDSRMNGVLNPGDLHLHTPNDSLWEATGILAGASAVYAVTEDLSGNVYSATGINGDVFKSANNGETWNNTANIPTALSVRSLMCDATGTLWAGIADSGDVFISTDQGGSWTPTAELVDAAIVSVLQEAAGSIYAGTYPNGDVFRTTDNGSSWLITSDVPAASDVMSMMFISDTLWIGTYANGDVFISTDNGSTWEAKADLSGVEAVLSLLHASDGDIYASTSWAKGVYKTTDRGASWFETDTIPNTTLCWALAEVDQTLYATSSDFWARIFKSTDGGDNWGELFDDPNAFEFYCLFYSTRGFILCGGETTTGAKVYRAGYFPGGYMVSSAYNAPGGYGTLSWSTTLNGMTETVRVRTDVNPDMSTAVPWPSCPSVTNGQDISGLSSVEDTEEYVQYRVEMTSTTNSRSPFLHWVSLEYGVIVSRDVGVSGILSPESVVQPAAPVAPSAQIVNYGAREESMWVFCQVDSINGAPTTVYLDSIMVLGLAASETTVATFADWTPGPSGSIYSVCAYSSVPEDTSAANDTVCVSVISFSSFLDMTSNFHSAPIIDGVVSAGEWDSANSYDISDIYGNQSAPNLPASCFASFLHDDVYLYVLVVTDQDTLLQSGDRATLLVDDDDDGTWGPSDSEGEYTLTHAGIDTVWFTAYPSLVEYQVTGASIAMGDSQGIVLEAAIPLGSAGPMIDSRPGDTLGLFIDFLDSGTTDYLGWWPQAVPDSSRTDPTHFGDLVLAPGTGLQEGMAEKAPRISGIVSVNPNPFRDETRIFYSVADNRGAVDLSIYDVSGRLVRRIRSGTSAPGFYSATWDSRSDDGRRVNSGVYLLRLSAGERTSTRKLTLLD